MQRNEQAQQLAYDWVRWLNTRRFLAPQMPPSFLSLFLERMPSNGEPDGPMSPDMPAFNAAVMAMLTQKPDLAFPFLKVYCGVPRGPVKTIAGNIGVSNFTYYDRAHKGAAEIIRRMNIAINLGLMRDTAVREKCEKTKKAA